MDNQSEYWRSLAQRISTPGQTKNRRPDTSDLEIQFITSYFQPTDEIIDLGSGSGLIVNKLVDKVKNITAVEKYPGFTKFILNHESITVINADLIGFKIRRQFDGVLCTGVSQCFPLETMLGIYRNMFDMLKPGGYFIMRMHCGLKEDVLVNGYSEELQTDYFGSYRQIDSEIEVLKEIGFKDIVTHDIFPDSLNVWENTRHFMFVCKK